MAVDRKSTRLNSSHTVIYPLSLHDALPISAGLEAAVAQGRLTRLNRTARRAPAAPGSEEKANGRRSEEHTSELQSHSDLPSFPTRRSSDLGWSRSCRRSRPPDPTEPHRPARARGARLGGESQWP